MISLSKRESKKKKKITQQKCDSDVYFVNGIIFLLCTFFAPPFTMKFSVVYFQWNFLINYKCKK